MAENIQKSFKMIDNVYVITRIQTVDTVITKEQASKIIEQYKVQETQLIDKLDKLRIEIKEFEEMLNPPQIIE